MTTPASSPPPAAPAEDPGSQALGDALRSGLRVLRFVMLLVFGIVLFSGMFTVEPNEVAVVLRFGRPVGTGAEQLLKPGLHWAFPYPIDEVVRVPVGQSHSVASSIGWYMTTPEQDAAGKEPPARGSLVPGVDGYTITADGNIIHARATLKYRIADPAGYAFRFASASNLLQNALNNALLDASAQFTADAAIYRDKLGFKDAVLARLGESIERHQLGITLDPFDVQVIAPLDVRPAFESVLAAEQERSRKINDARGYANEVTLKAGGEAEAVISIGRSASNRLVSAVSAEASYFNEQLPHFERNPALFSRRRLAETVELVMTNAQDKFLFPARNDGEPRSLRLQLSREPAKLSSRETPKP